MGHYGVEDDGIFSRIVSTDNAIEACYVFATLGEAKKETQGIHDAAEKESRSLTADEQEKFDKVKTDAADLSKRISTQRDINAVEDSKVEDMPGYVGLNEKETRKYSLLKAIRQASNG